MESTAVVFFLEKNQYFLLSRTLFRQGATAPKSWQVPPVITGGVGEDTQLKSYYSRRKTKEHSDQSSYGTEETKNILGQLSIPRFMSFSFSVVFLSFYGNSV